MGFSRQEYWSGLPLQMITIGIFTPMTCAIYCKCTDMHPYNQIHTVVWNRIYNFHHLTISTEKNLKFNRINETRRKKHPHLWSNVWVSFWGKTYKRTLLLYQAIVTDFICKSHLKMLHMFCYYVAQYMLIGQSLSRFTVSFLNLLKWIIKPKVSISFFFRIWIGNSQHIIFINIYN